MMTASCPLRRTQADTDGYWPAPLDAVGAAFRLLTTGPQPLALHAAQIHPGGLPDRLVPLDEITVLLLRPRGQRRGPQQGVG